VAYKLLDASELRPQTGLLFIPQVIYEYGQPLWNDSDRTELKNSEKNPSQCHFVHTNPILTDLGAEARGTDHRATSSEAHPASYPMGTGGVSFTGGKSDGTW